MIISMTPLHPMYITCKTSDVTGVKNLTLMSDNTVGRSPFRAAANDNLSKTIDDRVLEGIIKTLRFYH